VGSGKRLPPLGGGGGVGSTTKRVEGETHPRIKLESSMSSVIPCDRHYKNYVLIKKKLANEFFFEILCYVRLLDLGLGVLCSLYCLFSTFPSSDPPRIYRLNISESRGI
jgi:hypothetical protein